MLAAAGRAAAVRKEGDEHEAGAGGSTAAAQTVNVAARPVNGRLYAAVWYVPETRRFVKTIEEYYDTAGVRNERNILELESYKLAR